MGCSNPHPHGQAWSLSYIPTEAYKVLSSQLSYTSSSSSKSSNLLLDYATTEISSKSSRIVLNSEHFVALVPYWALWPYEVIICPNKRRIGNVTELKEEEKADLATVLRKMTCRYDNRAFSLSLPLLPRTHIADILLKHSLPMLLPIQHGHLPIPHFKRHDIRIFVPTPFLILSSFIEKRKCQETYCWIRDLWRDAERPDC